MPKQIKYDTKCSNKKTKYNINLCYVKEKSAHLNRNQSWHKPNTNKKNDNATHEDKKSYAQYLHIYTKQHLAHIAIVKQFPGNGAKIWTAAVATGQISLYKM